MFTNPSTRLLWPSVSSSFIYYYSSLPLSLPTSSLFVRYHNSHQSTFFKTSFPTSEVTYKIPSWNDYSTHLCHLQSSTSSPSSQYHISLFGTSGPCARAKNTCKHTHRQTPLLSFFTSLTVILPSFLHSTPTKLLYTNLLFFIPQLRA
jgi:hypothetical protein